MIKLDNLKAQLTDFADVTALLANANRDAEVSAPRWPFAMLDLEKALDAFMLQLAALDRPTAIKVAAGFARYAFNDVVANHLKPMEEFGFAVRESAPCLDGEPIEKQLKNVEAWLKEPGPQTEAIVKQGIDPSRQMNLWDEDLLPAKEVMFVWILEAPQLLSMSVVAGQSEADDADDSPYGWSYRACVSRSALCSLKALARSPRQTKKDLTNLFKFVGEVW